MTTVAFDGRVLAADRLVSGGFPCSMGKIWKLKSGAYFTGCGSYDRMVEVADWLDKYDPADGDAKRPWLPPEQDTIFILVSPEGQGAWLSWPYLRPVTFPERRFAVGSGSEYAIGAMAAGVGAVKAVRIASEYDADTGLGVDWVRVVKRTKK